MTFVTLTHEEARLEREIRHCRARVFDDMTQGEVHDLEARITHLKRELQGVRSALYALDSVEVGCSC